MKISDAKKAINTIPQGVWESSRPAKQNNEPDASLTSGADTCEAVSIVGDNRSGMKGMPDASLTTDLQGNGYPVANAARTDKAAKPSSQTR